MQEPAPNEAPPATSNRRALFIVFLVVVIDLLGFAIVLPLTPVFVADYAGSILAGGAKDPLVGVIVGSLMASFSLMQFIFAPNSPEVASALEFTIQAGLQRWLGDLIDVTELQVTAEDSSLKIVINYVVRGAIQPASAANQPQTAVFTRTV